MSDDELGGELDRVLRVALTTAGQLAERAARSRADAERTAHQATVDAQRTAERQLARQVEAGRAVYGGVRDPQLWEQPNAQRRLGEALVAAEALKTVDPLAQPASQYIRAEARRQHGPDSDAWLAAGVQAYLDEANEEGDRTQAAMPVPDPVNEERASRLQENPRHEGQAREEAVKNERQTAAEGFPVPAAEDLHRGGSPKARKAPASGPQRDRSRAR